MTTAAADRPEPTVVFDLYGVLARHQDPAGQRLMESILGLTEPCPALWEACWAHRPAYDRGDVEATAYWAAVGAAVRCDVPAGLVASLVVADMASWSRLDAAMLDLVHRLRDQGRELALLSNAPAELAAWLRSEQPWLGLFAAVVFSCEARAVKPEPEAYAAVEARLGRTPAELLMVDDRAENVTGARERGWAGFRFDDQAGLEALLTGRS